MENTSNNKQNTNASGAEAKEGSSLTKENKIPKHSLKIVRLKYNNESASFYLSDGHQTKESLEKCIKSLLHISDPLYSIVGLLEVPNSKEEDYEDAILIPLELIEVTNSVIDSSKYYVPHFWTPQVISDEGASEALQNVEPASTTPVPIIQQPELQAHESPIPPNEQINWQYPNTAPLLVVPTTGEDDFTSIDQHYGQQQPQQQAITQQYSQQTSTVQYDANDPWQNWEYFHQYGKLTIHNEMLKDESRTVTYKEGIDKNAKDLKGKVVMDLGTGTGILAFFCVAAGAEKVYAIEASDLADWTEVVVASNGLSDKIKVIKGRIEDLILPEKVDVIISEWMGTFLIFESMMESLLFARDKFLKPEGLMFPSHANIFLTPVTMDEYYKEKVEFWSSVYGVDMSSIIPFAKKCAFEKPLIDKAIKPECVLADPVILNSFDMKEVPIHKPYEKTVVPFAFKAKSDANMHGFAAWFDVSFLGTAKENVVLSTSPFHKDTHWHQDLFLFDTPVAVKQGYTIKGTVRYQRNPDLLRHLIIDIAFGIEEFPMERHSKRFYLWGNE